MTSKHAALGRVRKAVNALQTPRPVERVQATPRPLGKRTQNLMYTLLKSSIIKLQDFRQTEYRFHSRVHNP